MAVETPLRQQHQKLGATMGEFFGCALPARFTHLEEEYGAARQRVALLDTNFHAVISLSGPDRVRYLNAMLTAPIAALAPGTGAIGLLLNPQGRILAEMECYAASSELLTLSHALVRERTVSTLDKYIIMDDVTLEDRSETIGTVALEGPRAAAILQELAAVDLESMPEFAHSQATIGSLRCRVLRRSHFGEMGAEFLAPRGELAALWDVLLEQVQEREGQPLGYDAFNALRLEAGIPWFSYDFDDRVIPHEAGLETTHINFSKGCYTGQEIVERVRSRGQVNRRLVSLNFSGATPPAAGAALLAEGKEVGWVTSAAFSPAAGQAIGMGYLRREHNAPGTVLQTASGSATVAALPRVGAVRDSLRTARNS